MINLTHDESSAIDVGGIWTGFDEFELTFRFNHDNKPDFIVDITLNKEELTQLTEYLKYKLKQVKVN